MLIKVDNVQPIFACNVSKREEDKGGGKINSLLVSNLSRTKFRNAYAMCHVVRDTKVYCTWKNDD